MDEDEGGGGRRAVDEVGDPEVIARLGALGARDLQPAAIAAHGDAVVVGHRHARAEHLDVLVWRRPDAVEVHAPVKVALGLGQKLRRDPTHVVEGVATDEPGDRAEAAAVDRAVDDIGRRDVHHVDDRLLGTAFGELISEAVPLLGGLPAVEGREAGRVEGHWVDKHPLCAVRLDDVQHRELLPRLAPGDEPAGIAPVRRRHRARPEQPRDLLREGVAGRPGLALRLGQGPLIGRPQGGPLVRRLLEPAIGVGYRAAVVHVCDVGPVGVGVGRRRRFDTGGQ